MTSPAVFASSSQAYNDYRFQFDQYRQNLTDFQNAYDQYKQFQSLAAQQDTVDKVKALLAQRNAVAKTYFLFLNERITEDPGLNVADAQNFRNTLTNQIGLLDGISAQVPAVGSLSDAATLSNLFVKNYFPMQISYRKTIVGLEIGYLQYFLAKYDAAAAQAQIFIQASRGDASPEKIGILDRWMVNLSNKHSVVDQDIKTIQASVSKIAGDTLEQDRQLASIRKLVTNAKTDLTEGTSYLSEVEDALQYE